MKTSIETRRGFLKNSFAAVSACCLFSPYAGFFSFLDNARFSSPMFTFQVGKFKCTLLRDFEFVSFSPDEPKPGPLDLSQVRWEMQLTDPSPFVALLVEVDDLKILIDTGIGCCRESIELDGKGYHFSGKLMELLASQNITGSEIGMVILTHFHPDHIGGVFDEQGQLNFPNARFFVHQNEYEFWTSSSSKKQAGLSRFFIEKNIKPLRKEQLTRWNGTVEEIVHGLRLVNTPGHTPGHLTVCIGEGREQFLYTADSFFHPKHIENISWHHHFDFDHSRSVKSRRMLLDWAAHENMLVQASHFDFPGLGHVEKDGHKWRWKELQTTRP